MKIIKRETIKVPEYREILDTETHHDHIIIKDSDGVLRWKENAQVPHLLEKINLNHLIPLLKTLGYDQNSEIYRKLYRDMGYSLSGYWEIFYWEVNNPLAKKYKPKKV